MFDTHINMVFAERFFENSWFWKNQHTTKSIQSYLVGRVFQPAFEVCWKNQ